MQNKWMLLLGLWVIFIGLCFLFVDKAVSFMMIFCIVVGVAGVVGFIINNITAAKNRRDMR